MRTIWKYPIQVTDRQSVRMPTGSTVLSCQFQDGQLCLWAMVNSDLAVKGADVYENRIVYVIGTGHQIPNVPLGFISTVQMAGGTLIFHVFMEQ